MRKLFSILFFLICLLGFIQPSFAGLVTRDIDILLKWNDLDQCNQAEKVLKKLEEHKKSYPEEFRNISEKLTNSQQIFGLRLVKEGDMKSAEKCLTNLKKHRPSNPAIQVIGGALEKKKQELARESEEWKVIDAAMNSDNKKKGYEEFLRKYPDSWRVPKVKELLAYTEAVHSENKINALEIFLKKYPNSFIKGKAKESLRFFKEEQAVENASNSKNPVKELQAIIKENPDSSQAPLIKEKIAWLKAKNENTIESYERFLIDFRNSTNSSEGEELLKTLKDKKIAERDAKYKKERAEKAAKDATKECKAAKTRRSFCLKMKVVVSQQNVIDHENAVGKEVGFVNTAVLRNAASHKIQFTKLAEEKIKKYKELTGKNLSKEICQFRKGIMIPHYQNKEINGDIEKYCGTTN